MFLYSAVLHLQGRFESDLTSASGGAFSVLLWELGITLDDEVNLIWSKPNHSWIKWNFLFARYFILGIQFLSQCLKMAIRYDYELNQNLIRAWYSTQILAAAFAMSSLELVLMARVYALYSQSRNILIVLASLLALEFVVAIAGLAATLPGHAFTSVSITTRLPASFAYYAFAALVVQCTILGLTLRVYVKGTMSAVPLVRLMARDGTLTFFVITLFEIFVAIYALFRIEYAITAYDWLLTVVSSSACRLIINMLKLSPAAIEAEAPDSTTHSTNLQFTVILNERITFETVNTVDSSYRPANRSWNIP